jgi:sugar lactone lactonase YvrE
MRSTRLVIDGLQLPESPRWSHGRLWLSDIRGGRVYSVIPGSRARIEATFDEPCSGIGFLDDGTPIVTLMRSSRIVRLDPDGPSLHADLSSLQGTHLNDLVTNRRGRAYANRLAYEVAWGVAEQLPDGQVNHQITIDASPAPGVTDAIALVEPDGSYRLVAESLLGPNGMAISPEGDMLAVSEWRARRVTVLDIDAATGDLANPRVLFASDGRAPDGLCFDARGCVWVASATTAECLLIEPSGRIADIVVPSHGTNVTACVLGGEDRRTLFLTAYRGPGVSAGVVESVRVRVPGAGNP